MLAVVFGLGLPLWQTYKFLFYTYAPLDINRDEDMDNEEEKHDEFDE